MKRLSGTIFFRYIKTVNKQNSNLKYCQKTADIFYQNTIFCWADNCPTEDGGHPIVVPKDGGHQS